jgi:type IV pilus assembly protein PilY1
MGTARTADGKVQPITVAPLLGEPVVEPSKQRMRVVAVGTGRYLGSDDLSDVTTQSFYVFRERLDNTSLGNLRRDGNLVQQVMDSLHQAPTTQNVDWSTKNGWYIDFDKSSGERVNVEMDLQLNPGMVTVATTVPAPTPCSPGGTSWLYYFRLDTGALLASEQAQVLIVGLGNLVENTGKDERMATITVRNDGSIKRTGAPIGGGGTPPPSGLKRTSWRELVN